MSETLDSETIKDEQPTEEPRMPSSIPYIIGNECAERFAYYGMVTVLVLYMTEQLGMAQEDASYIFHLFKFVACILPFLGGLLADLYWGKYKVIFRLSIIYSIGMLTMSLPGSVFNLTDKQILLIGLGIVAFGNGGIKSCVSSFVGDQFNVTNQSLLSKVYNWFYLSVNVGSFFSTMLTPWLMKAYGPRYAFGVPALLMIIAVITFWWGRNLYHHAPTSSKSFFSELRNPDCLKCLGKIFLVYIFLIPFIAMYDQMGSRWMTQASHMDTHIFAGLTFLPESIRNFQILPAQMSAINPILVLTLIPLLTTFVYPAIDRFYKLTLVRKMLIGLSLGTIASLFPWYFEIQYTRGVPLNINWQALAYVFLTVAEVMVFVPALELAYTQAPKTMKSMVMSFKALPNALANLLAAFINILAAKGLTIFLGTNYYLFFVIFVTVNTIAFFFISRGFKEQTILQD